MHIHCFASTITVKRVVTLMIMGLISTRLFFIGGCTVFVSLYDVSVLKCDGNVSVLIIIRLCLFMSLSIMVIASVLLAH